MEFHTLTRRELQSLCKKNKIPANITNAAMVEALKALQIVEGIDDLIQPSQSESVQSSINSLEGGLEVTSPYVPPTGGRTTRRRNDMNEELEAVTSVTVTRRTTRRTTAKASRVDIMETPAMTSRRKGQMASACRKMDSQFNECVEEEEEKKVVSMTPAPLSITNRKGRKEEVTVQKVYSTRRSVRLAEKNVDMLNDVKSEESEIVNNEFLDTTEFLAKDGEKQENEESELVTNELLAKDGEKQENEESELVTNEKNQEVNLVEDNEGGIDAIINVENYEKKEKSEIVSAEEVDEGESCIGYAEEAQPDEEISDNVEFHGGEESIEPEKSEEVPAEVLDLTHEGESCTEFAAEAQLDEISEFPDPVEPLNVSDEVEQSESMFHQISNTEVSVDVCTFETETTVENSEEFDGEIYLADESVEQVLENKIAVDDDAESCNEIEQELQDAKKIGPESVQDFNVALVKLTELRLQEEDAEVVADDHVKKTASDDDALTSEKNSPSKNVSSGAVQPNKHTATTISDLRLQQEDVEVVADDHFKKTESNDNALTIEKNSPSKQASSGPVQPNKHTATIISDNKENPGSGTKLVIMKERKMAGKVSGVSLNDLSLRKLTKMFKEKLEITKKSSNEVSEQLTRTALQPKN